MAEERMQDLAFRGLPADDFWEVFVQCVTCRKVIPRHYYPYIHECVVNVLKAEKEKYWALVKTRLELFKDFHDHASSDSEHDYDSGASARDTTPGPASDDSVLDNTNAFQAVTAALRRQARADRLLDE